MRYTTDSSASSTGFDMPEVSRAIETALRNAAKVRTDNGRPTGHFRALDPIEARQITADAAQETILNRTNLDIGGNYLEQHPFEHAFDQICDQRGLADYRQLMDAPLLKETFGFAMQSTRGVVAMEDMPGELDQVRGRYFHRPAEKLQQIEAMFGCMPAHGPFTGHRRAIRLRGKHGDGVFAHCLEHATQVAEEDLIRQRQTTSTVVRESIRAERAQEQDVQFSRGTVAASG